MESDIAFHQKKIDEYKREIPSFIKESMSDDEIRNAIFSRVRETGETQYGVSPRILDASYTTSDNRFVTLVKELNNTLPNGHDRENYYIERVSKLTSNLTTREIGNFVVNEAGLSHAKGRGRQGYINSLGVDLHQRFTRGVMGGHLRPKLTEPDWDYIDKRVKEIRERFRSIKRHEEDISEIKAKYRSK